MLSKTAVSLTTGLEDPERVTIALLVAVGSAEAGHPTLMFVTKEAARLATNGVAVGTACDGCPDIPSLMDRFATAGGTFLVCPLCFRSRALDDTTLVANASLGGSVQLWEWIGEEAANCFSY